MIDWQKDCKSTMLFLSALGWQAGQTSDDTAADVEKLKENCALLIRAATQKTAGQAQYGSKNDVDWKSLDMILMNIALSATSLCLSGYLGDMPEQVKNIEED